MDDGKGIGRRVNQNPHHPEELQQSLKEGAQFVEQPCLQPLPSGANSRLGEPIKQELQPLGGRHMVLDQEIESFFLYILIRYSLIFNFFIR